MGGRRKGKTKLLQFAAFRTAAAGGLVLWTSGDSKLAEVGWQELTTWLEGFSSRYAPSGKGVVTIEGGGEIRRVTAANATSGRGPTPDLVIVDECQTVREAFIDRARPSIMVNGGRMLLAGTPPDSAQQMKDAEWIRKRLDNPARFPEWLMESKPTTVEDIAHVIRCRNKAEKKPWAEYMAVAQAELDNYRLEVGDETYMREIEAQWIIKTGGRVLCEFNGTNVDEKFGFNDREGDVYWALDRGEGAAYTVCLFCQAMLSRPGVSVFGEKFRMEIIDEGDFVEQCLAYSDEMGWPRPKMGVYDVRAPRFRQALWENNIQPYGRNRVVNEGIVLLNSGFRKKWVNYHPRCVQLNEEMWTWNIMPNGNPSDKHRDGADALRYLYEYLIDHFGPQWRKMSKTEDLQSLQRTRLDTVFTFSWV